MRIALIFLVCCLLFVSCENESPDYKKMIVGNWQCAYVDQNGDTLQVNLYFNDSIGHFFFNQNNDNVFKIQNDSIIIVSKESRNFRKQVLKQIFKIIHADNNRLQLVSLSGWLNKNYDSIQFDTLQFERMKKKNNLEIRKISFYSSGCFGPCPSFKLEMNANDYVKFEGFSNTLRSGIWTGKSSEKFWELMKDKCAYIDFKNWKEDYSAPWTDDQRCSLVLETNKGIFKVSIYGDDKEPRAIRNVINYIFLNYEDFQLTKPDCTKFEFSHDRVLKQIGSLPEEKILQFIPPH